MKTFAEVLDWMEGAAEEFPENPAIPVCQLFFRWEEIPARTFLVSTELVASADTSRLDHITLWVQPNAPASIPVRVGRQQLAGLTGEVEIFGAEKIAPGLWRLMPSLNIPGLIHAFIVLHGVPKPAPWEKRLIVVAA